MSAPRDNLAVHEHTREEAIEWLVKFSEGDVTRSACSVFEAWLRSSPEHVRAYLQVSAFWEAAGNLNRTRKLEVEELVRRAADESNVVALAATSHGAGPARVERTQRRPRWGALAAGVVLACLMATFAGWWLVIRAPVYTTAVGEQRTMTLADGSTVELNSRSKIRIRYSERERTVELLEGQALFSVAKNQARPFIVESGAARVRALGTQFDVYKKPTGTVVTVVEGHVAVSDQRAGSSRAQAGAAVPPALLDAGDQVMVNAREVTSPTRANPAVATAWTRGRLIFDSTPLAEVVQEFNRYNPRPLSIDDPALLSLHVSGTFTTTDSAQIVQFLSERFALTVHDAPDAIRLSHE